MIIFFVFLFVEIGVIRGKNGDERYPTVLDFVVK
jgi:hypothetical protein